jgi:hypothetical protein
MNVSAFYPGFLMMPGGQIQGKAHADTISELRINIQISHGKIECVNQ